MNVNLTELELSLLKDLKVSFVRLLKIIDHCKGHGLTPIFSFSEEEGLIIKEIECRCDLSGDDFEKSLAGVEE